MKNLFTPPGLMLLEAFCLNKSLLAFDFDGTLSRIVTDPLDATLPSRTGALLEELSRDFPVAVLSGRSEHDLREKLGLRVSNIVGNHGLEGLSTSPELRERAQVASRRWCKTLEPAVAELKGAEIEDKHYSLTLHFRKSRNKREIKRRLQAAIAKLSPAPRVIPGKCIFNLIPKGSPHKGVALLELMRRLGRSSALYIGDDDTDEDVFSLPYPHILSVRVGRTKSSKAAFFVESQRDVDKILDQIREFSREDSP